MDRLHELKRYVIADNRVWPLPWDRLYKSLKKSHPDLPVPLILGGSIASDAAKRLRLLQQLDHISDSIQSVDFADNFLRSLSADQWAYSECDPPSNKDSYGNEDVPQSFYLLLIP